MVIYLVEKNIVSGLGERKHRQTIVIKLSYVIYIWYSYCCAVLDFYMSLRGWATGMEMLSFS